MIGNSQSDFFQGYIMLTRVNIFCDEMTGSADEGRAVHVTYLDWS